MRHQIPLRDKFFIAGHRAPTDTSTHKFVPSADCKSRDGVSSGRRCLLPSNLSYISWGRSQVSSRLQVCCTKAPFPIYAWANAPKCQLVRHDSLANHCLLQQHLVGWHGTYSSATRHRPAAPRVHHQRSRSVYTCDTHFQKAVRASSFKVTLVFRA